MRISQYPIAMGLLVKIYKFYSHIVGGGGQVYD